MFNLDHGFKRNPPNNTWVVETKHPSFTISKEIGFDYGHRVPDHASKCKNPHGHRGKVVAYCQSTTLIDQGSQSGMVLDFSFLKEILTTQIHDLFDHRFIIYKGDELLKNTFGLETPSSKKIQQVPVPEFPELKPIDVHETASGFIIVEIPLIPTAENLAFLSFYLLRELVVKYSKENAILTQVDFWETPTSMASFSL